MKLRKIAQWSRSSLFNVVVLCEVAISAPSFLAFCVANYLEGSLTLAWALWILAATVAEGIAFALPTWFLFVAPHKKARLGPPPPPIRQSSSDEK
jgi:hypothetical protein